MQINSQDARRITKTYLNKALRSKAFEDFQIEILGTHAGLYGTVVEFQVAVIKEVLLNIPHVTPGNHNVDIMVKCEVMYVIGEETMIEFDNKEDHFYLLDHKRIIPSPIKVISIIGWDTFDSEGQEILEESTADIDHITDHTIKRIIEHLDTTTFNRYRDNDNGDVDNDYLNDFDARISDYLD